MMNFEYGSRHNSHQHNPPSHERQDSYDGSSYQAAKPLRYDRTYEDRSHSGNRVQNNNFMPPRYPQSIGYGGKSGANQQPQQDFHQGNNGKNNFVMSPKNAKGGIPRGGTGATDDSFLSSQKQQQQQQQQQQHYSANYGNPPSSSYSQMGLTANSFHQMADTSSNSFDIAAANHLNGGGLASFSNTATDWNMAQRASYLEMGVEHVSDTRSTKWTNYDQEIFKQAKALQNTDLRRGRE